MSDPINYLSFKYTGKEFKTTQLPLVKTKNRETTRVHLFKKTAKNINEADDVYAIAAKKIKPEEPKQLNFFEKGRYIIHRHVQKNREGKVTETWYKINKNSLIKRLSNLGINENEIKAQISGNFTKSDDFEKYLNEKAAEHFKKDKPSNKIVQNPMLKTEAKPPKRIKVQETEQELQKITHKPEKADRGATNPQSQTDQTSEPDPSKIAEENPPIKFSKITEVKPAELAPHPISEAILKDFQTKVNLRFNENKKITNSPEMIAFNDALTKNPTIKDLCIKGVRNAVPYIKDVLSCNAWITIKNACFYIQEPSFFIHPAGQLKDYLPLLSTQEKEEIEREVEVVKNQIRHLLKSYFEEKNKSPTPPESALKPSKKSVKVEQRPSERPEAVDYLNQHKEAFDIRGEKWVTEDLLSVYNKYLHDNSQGKLARPFGVNFVPLLKTQFEDDPWVCPNPKDEDYKKSAKKYGVTGRLALFFAEMIEHNPEALKQNVAIPVTLNDNHWCLFFIDPETKTIEFFDSFGKAGEHPQIKKEAEDLQKVLRIATKQNYRYENKVTKAVQFDGHQCGIWALKFTEERQKNPNLQVEDLATSDPSGMIQNHRELILDNFCDKIIPKLKKQLNLVG